MSPNLHPATGRKANESGPRLNPIAPLMVAGCADRCCAALTTSPRPSPLRHERQGAPVGRGRLEAAGHGGASRARGRPPPRGRLRRCPARHTVFHDADLLKGHARPIRRSPSPRSPLPEREVIVYDYVDSGVAMLAGMALKRAPPRDCERRISPIIWSRAIDGVCSRTQQDETAKSYIKSHIIEIAIWLFVAWTVQRMLAVPARRGRRGLVCAGGRGARSSLGSCGRSGCAASPCARCACRHRHGRA